MSKDTNENDQQDAPEVAADTTPAVDQIEAIEVLAPDGRPVAEALREAIESAEPGSIVPIPENVEAILEPVTVDSAVRALIAALGHEETFIKGLQITADGKVRIFGVDNSARSVKFAPLERQKRAADGSIIS